MENKLQNGPLKTLQENARMQAEIAEEKILSEMGEQEKGEYNQEELVDDITHLRSSKTRRGY